jgi:hypothetical protein
VLQQVLRGHHLLESYEVCEALRPAEVVQMFEILNDTEHASATSAATLSPVRLLYWAVVARGSPAARRSSRETPRHLGESPADGVGWTGRRSYVLFFLEHPLSLTYRAHGRIEA